MKKLVGLLLIAIVFAVGIYLIAKLPGSQGSGTPVEPPTGQGTEEEWLGIFLQGQRIGYSFTVTTDIEKGLMVENRTSMTITMMGSAQTLNTHLFAQTDDAYTLRKFSVTISTPGHETRVDGTIDGSTLTLTSQSQGITQTEKIALSEKPFFPEAIEMLIKKKGLMPGDEITVPYFDPTTQSSTTALIKMMDKEKVTVFDREYVGSRVEVTAMGITSVMWFDADYKLIRESSPALGIDMIPMSREEALAAIDPGDAFDLLSFFSVKLDSPIPEPKTLVYLKLQLENINPAELDLTDDFQRVVSHTPLQVEFQLPVLNDIPDLTLPIGEHREYLRPTVYIQCEAKEIIEQARKTLAGEKDAKRAVGLLVHGVYAMLEKNPTASLPSAIDVLRTREGDCTEHSILFAALARAAGIPTKIYVGLVNMYGNEYYYHAWCAVWLDRWVPVDPTFNQFPADLGHMKLKEGGLAQWAKVMQVVGQLQIQAIDYTTQ